jgi:hypothetical protein
MYREPTLLERGGEKMKSDGDIVGVVARGAGVEEEPNDVNVAVGCGKMQRGHSILFVRAG